jgi:hypothetical protein
VAAAFFLTAVVGGYGCKVGAWFLRRERAGKLCGVQGRLYPQVKADINGFPKSAEVFNGPTMATAYGGEADGARDVLV